VTTSCCDQFTANRWRGGIDSRWAIPWVGRETRLKAGLKGLEGSGESYPGDPSLRSG
jgi:hypothetical protein